MCDYSNGLPTESFFEDLDATNIVGVEADEQLRFGKCGPHHASKKGFAP